MGKVGADGTDQLCPIGQIDRRDDGYPVIRHERFFERREVKRLVERLRDCFFHSVDRNTRGLLVQSDLADWFDIRLGQTGRQLSGKR